jgi:hypothetical protein
MNSDHLPVMRPKSRADKSPCSNLYKGKEVVSVIVFRDVPHSIQRSQLAMNCQKFLDDPIVPLVPYVVQSDASLDAFSHLMESLNGSEPQFSPQISDDLMLLAREFGHNGLLAIFALRQDVPSRRENVRDLLQELGRVDRGGTFEADLLLIRNSLAVREHNISAIREALDGDFERILSELEKMSEKVNRPSKECQSDQRAFVEKLIEWVAVKSISFRSISHPLFRDMIQLVNPDFSVPVYSTLSPHIKCLMDLYRQLPEGHAKGECSLMVDGEKKFSVRFLAVTMFTEGYVRSMDLKGLDDDRAVTIANRTVVLRSSQLWQPRIMS